jgi:diguanylate cyclase (GGDEF)-like protein
VRRHLLLQPSIIPALALVVLAAIVVSTACHVPPRLTLVDWLGLVLLNALLAIFIRWQVVAVGRGYSGLLARLEHDATHNGVTGLPNRTPMRAKLEQIIASDRAEDAACGVFSIDLNGFKSLNDTLLHPAGDAILKLASVRMRTAIREGTLLAHTGGDEFTVIAPGAGHEAATDIAARLLAAVSLTLNVETYTLNISASIGIALYPEHGSDPDTLLARADEAMYAAKRARTGCHLWGSLVAAQEARP